MAAGTQQDMGHAVVIDTGRVEIVLFSRHVEPFDVNTLLSASASTRCRSATSC